jgi:undecaprenyl-diphosphatase
MTAADPSVASNHDCGPIMVSKQVGCISRGKCDNIDRCEICSGGTPDGTADSRNRFDEWHSANVTNGSIAGVFTIFTPMLSTLTELDTSLLWWIHAHHNAALDWLMPILRSKWTWLPLYVFILAFIVMNYGKRGGVWLLFFVCTIGLADLTSSKLVKPQVNRMRPCHTEHVLERMDLLVSCGGRYSFTSSHATNHFAMAAFIFFTLGGIFKRIRWPIMIWAGLIAFAQVYVGVHYPLDVIGGAMLGVLIGGAAARYYNYGLPVWAIGASKYAGP